jgi:hypothetical protein
VLSVREPGWAPSRRRQGDSAAHPDCSTWTDACERRNLRRTAMFPRTGDTPLRPSSGTLGGRRGRIDRSVWAWARCPYSPTHSPARQTVFRPRPSMVDPSTPVGKCSCRTDRERRGSLHLSWGHGLLEPEFPDSPLECRRRPVWRPRLPLETHARGRPRGTPDHRKPASGGRVSGRLPKASVEWDTRGASRPSVCRLGFARAPCYSPARALPGGRCSARAVRRRVRSVASYSPSVEAPGVWLGSGSHAQT